jgi:mRNA-degrading endonuclease RelE of RelBE toxin-antitoxin system
MSYNIIPTDKFKKQAKKLVKKYSSLKKELENFALELSLNPEQGKSLGNNTFKVRLSVKSKNKGKSGGMRVITFIIKPNKEVYLLTIYDKADIESVDDNTITKLIENIIVSR